MRIDNRFTVLITLLFALVIGFSALSLFNLTRDAVKSALGDQQLLFAKGIGRELDLKVVNLQKTLAVLGAGLSAGYFRSPGRPGPVISDRRLALVHFPLGVFLYDTRGRLVDSISVTPHTGREAPLLALVRQTQASQRSLISDPYLPDNKDDPAIPRLAFSSLIHDQGGELVGILVGVTNPFAEGFLAELLDFRLGKSGYAYLITPQRLMVVHPDAARVMKITPPGGNRLFDSAVNGFEGAGETINSTGIPMLVAFKRMETTGWILGINYLQQEAYAPLIVGERIIFGTLAAAMLIFAGLTLYLSRSITQPLRQVVEQIELLSEHPDALTPLEGSATGEVQALTVAFNRLVTQVHLDAMRRSALEDESRWSEQRLREITDALGDAVFVRDREALITFVNPEVCKLLGFSESELLGQSSHALFHHMRPDGSPYPLAECAIDAAASSGLHQVMEDTFWRKDGTSFPVSLIVSPLVRDEQLIGSVMSFRDMTESRRSQQELMDARDLANASMQVKSEFLANMSHEIRTPMNGVLGMSELLLATEITPEQREYVEMMQFSGEYLLTIINEILDFSKIESNRLELDPVSFVLRHEMTEILQPMLLRARRKGLRVAIRFANDLPRNVFGDPARLSQILVNLLGNAIKFTSSGEIDLLIAPEADQDALAATCHLHFSVRDSGIGIAPDKIDHIFEAFSQADGSISREYGGTGLGLTISQQLVQRMGGRIWVESTLGKGSTFHFTVRLGKVAELPVSGSRISDSHVLAPRTLNLLLAEDNPANQVFAVTTLSKAGHRVTVANNGEEAVRLAVAQSFDAILMDVQMPVVDGFSATRQLRERGMTLPIIALTAHAMKGFREECLANGMNDYLSKPFHSEDLLAKLQMLGVGVSKASFPVQPTPAAPSLSAPVFVAASVLAAPVPTNAPEPLDNNVLDIGSALEMASDDIELLRTVLAMVDKQIDEDLPMLHALLGLGGAGELKDAAHRLKGSLAIVGARNAHAACLALETLAREGRIAACAAALQRLDAQIEVAQQAIRKLIST